MRRRCRADLLQGELGGPMEIPAAFCIAVCAVALSLGK